MICVTFNKNYGAYQKKKKAKKKIPWRDKTIIRTRLKYDVDVGIWEEEFKLTTVNMLKALLEKQITYKLT